MIFLFNCFAHWNLFGFENLIRLKPSYCNLNSIFVKYRQQKSNFNLNIKSGSSGSSRRSRTKLTFLIQGFGSVSSAGKRHTPVVFYPCSKCSQMDVQNGGQMTLVATISPGFYNQLGFASNVSCILSSLQCHRLLTTGTLHFC